VTTIYLQSPEGEPLGAYEPERDESVMDCLQRRGVSIKGSCFGSGDCGECALLVLSGGDKLPKPALRERRTLEKLKAPPTARLSCYIAADEDMVVARI